MIDLVNEAPITAADRATFDRFLASFRFASLARVVTATDSGCALSLSAARRRLRSPRRSAS